MAAATINRESETVMAYDAVELELSDGETYVSRLSKPIGAILTLADNSATSGSAVNLDYALSDRTFTIRYEVAGTGVTDKKVSILAYGKR